MKNNKLWREIVVRGLGRFIRGRNEKGSKKRKIGLIQKMSQNKNKISNKILAKKSIPKLCKSKQDQIGQKGGRGRHYPQSMVETRLSIGEGAKGRRN